MEEEGGEGMGEAVLARVSHTVLQEHGAHGTVLLTSVYGRHLSK